MVESSVDIWRMNHFVQAADLEETRLGQAGIVDLPVTLGDT